MTISELLQYCMAKPGAEQSVHNDWKATLKWFTEFGHLNRGDMLTSEQHRCSNEKKKF